MEEIHVGIYFEMYQLHRSVNQNQVDTETETERKTKSADSLDGRAGSIHHQA